MKAISSFKTIVAMHCYVGLSNTICNCGVLFLNQARAGLRPARAWFLEIVSVRMSVCVCVFVCVSAPEAINN